MVDGVGVGCDVRVWCEGLGWGEGRGTIFHFTRKSLASLARAPSIYYINFRHVLYEIIFLCNIW